MQGERAPGSFLKAGLVSTIEPTSTATAAVRAHLPLEHRDMQWTGMVHACDVASAYLL